MGVRPYNPRKSKVAFYARNNNYSAKEKVTKKKKRRGGFPFASVP